VVGLVEGQQIKPLGATANDVPERSSREKLLTIDRRGDEPWITRPPPTSDVSPCA
jgi:hypothetical protein